MEKRFSWMALNLGVNWYATTFVLGSSYRFSLAYLQGNRIFPGMENGSLMFPMPTTVSGAVASMAVSACSLPIPQSTLFCLSGLLMVPRSRLQTSSPADGEIFWFPHKVGLRGNS